MPDPIPLRRVTERRKIEDLDGDHIVLSHLEPIPARDRKIRKKPWKGQRVYALVDPKYMGKFETTVSEQRALHYVLENTILENGTGTIIASHMAQHCGWSNSFAAKILRNLVARNALIPIGPKTYRVNAFLAYRGDASSWNEQTLIDPEPIWERP